MVSMNFLQCWQAKLARPHFFKVQSGKITVCDVYLFWVFFCWPLLTSFIMLRPKITHQMCIVEAKIVAPITKREQVCITDSTKSPTTLRFLSNSEVALFWYYLRQGKQISHSRMWVCRGSLSTFFWSRKNLIAVCKNKLDQKIKNKVSILSRVSVQGVESIWSNCRFIPADWGS